MQWRNLITENPEILAGKPVVAGTRLSVDFVLDLLAQGWTEKQLLENYPGLSQEALGLDQLGGLLPVFRPGVD